MCKVVVFRTGNEEYGIPLEFVVSIEKMGTSTPIPQMSDYIKGIIKVREELIPIIDLEYIFYQRYLKTDENARLIVIQSEKLLLGLLVNEAKEIIEIPDDKIKQVGLISFANTAYISGVASLDNQLITIINPETLVGSLDGIADLQDYMKSHH
ncbi:chemotaxis protein CheW [Neobacillus sp. PS3-40]|uniref:chemotaxis protein CheW n=1 Tax=Neobacillus sp. PS3-40 TaxID=3070679 RepID=UPI0027DEEC27|nr:chemotaxis protein CheW [Neobacillus sp. PS3-40]WML45211.1 chemotaxis protein CheW [Neobacillus sp. PS3-40]